MNRGNQWRKKMRAMTIMQFETSVWEEKSREVTQGWGIFISRDGGVHFGSGIVGGTIAFQIRARKVVDDIQ